jgi:autotransporter-associated beta strand protein
LAGSGNITNLSLPQGAAGFISNSVSTSTLYAVITSTGPGLVWTGTNSGAGLTNLWDINTTVNWLLNTTATKYQQTIIPGDSVTFNDTGSGGVRLSNNVGPANLVISNNAVTYTFGGTGSILGPTGLQKLGTGTAILNLTNNSYVGGTVVSGGTLQMGSASAISSTANLTVNSGGTLELAGFNQNAGELTGNGIINDASPNSLILTVGTASGGVWNGTIQDQGLGGVSLTKVGTGTWVVGGTNRLRNGNAFTTQAQINGGTVVITNGGLVDVSLMECWIAGTVGSTSTVVVAGGTFTVDNNWLVIGRGDPTANGTLIVNGGTVQKAGANNIVVGSLGAQGALIVNGGQVLNNADLWLGENAGASGVLQLNGGLVQADVVRPNGTTPATSEAFFNGGTLQATTNSANFIQVQSMVMSNGLVLDDGGFAVSLGGAILNAGDPFNGGFVKKGSGTVYLDVSGNTYTGTTLVTNGTLAGVGSIAGPLVVGPAGNLGAGDAGGIGTFTLSGSNVTLQGKATMRINRDTPTSDLVTGIGTINYGGVLVISNLSTTLLTTSDTFQLFSAASSTGNFASIVGSPGPGLAYSFNPTTGVLSITTAVVKSVPHFTSVSLSGTTLTIAGTNGTPSQPYVLLGGTNLTTSLSLWTPILTNSFDINGNFNLTTNIVNPAVPRQFYLLQQ